MFLARARAGTPWLGHSSPSLGLFSHSGLLEEISFFWALTAVCYSFWWTALSPHLCLWALPVLPTTPNEAFPLEGLVGKDSLLLQTAITLSLCSSEGPAHAPRRMVMTGGHPVCLLGCKLLADRNPCASIWMIFDNKRWMNAWTSGNECTSQRIIKWNSTQQLGSETPFPPNEPTWDHLSFMTFCPTRGPSTIYKDGVFGQRSVLWEADTMVQHWPPAEIARFT